MQVRASRAAHSSQKRAPCGLSCWHRGHFIGYSPRAVARLRSSTIARGLGVGQIAERGFRAGLYPSFFRFRLLQPKRHAHVAVHRRRGGEMRLGVLVLARAPIELSEGEVAVGDQRAHAQFSGNSIAGKYSWIVTASSGVAAFQALWRSLGATSWALPGWSLGWRRRRAPKARFLPQWVPSISTLTTS